MHGDYRQPQQYFIFNQGRKVKRAPGFNYLNIGVCFYRQLPFQPLQFFGRVSQIKNPVYVYRAFNGPETALTSLFHPAFEPAQQTNPPHLVLAAFDAIMQQGFRVRCFTRQTFEISYRFLPLPNLFGRCKLQGIYVQAPKHKLSII